MKPILKLLMICAVLSAGILSLHLLGSDAYAAEGTSQVRFLEPVDKFPKLA